MELKVLHVGKQCDTSVCPRLSPLGEGTGLILPFFNSRLKLNLKGKLVHEAMSPVMCTPLFQGILSVFRNTFSSSLANQEDADETKIHLHHEQPLFPQNFKICS